MIDADSMKPHDSVGGRELILIATVIAFTVAISYAFAWHPTPDPALTGPIASSTAITLNSTTYYLYNTSTLNTQGCLDAVYSISGNSTVMLENIALMQSLSNRAHLCPFVNGLQIPQQEPAKGI